ncbi:MAG TPA: S8 family serine peptidase [Micromonosporaceae bacterium]|nr:S8 family serine peptidase [Micromonosporaceae bacterium]
MRIPWFTVGKHRIPAVAFVAMTVTAGLVGSPAAAGTASADVRNAGGATAIQDSYVVVLKDAVAARDAVDRTADAVARRYGGTVEHRYTSALRGFSVRTSAARARRIAADPAVAFVEQNHVVRLADSQVDPQSWGLDRVDQRTLPLDRSYSYPASGGAGVHAYVVDSGFRFTHRDLAGRAVTGIDLVDGGSADDCNGHGTHVAGTLGGSTFGVAKAVTLVAVRVFDCIGFGDLAQTVAGVDWITANAVKPAVANLSLGFPPGYDGDGILDVAVARSINTGISYAVSAGNLHSDACAKSPARVPAAITVAGSQHDDIAWPSSNDGPCVDLFAPALYVVSAGINTDDESWTRSGTSMAAPHVAGAAAILLSAQPTWTPEQVRNEIVGQATPDVLGWVTPGTPNLLLYIGGEPVAAAPS